MTSHPQSSIYSYSHIRLGYDTLLHKWEDEKNPAAVLLFNIRECDLLPVHVRDAARVLLEQRYEGYSPEGYHWGIFD